MTPLETELLAALKGVIAALEKRQLDLQRELKRADDAIAKAEAAEKDQGEK